MQYTDGLPGDLSTAHPSILSDGSLLNFTRSLPNGGFHVYRQEPHTLKRSEVSVCEHSLHSPQHCQPCAVQTTARGAGMVAAVLGGCLLHTAHALQLSLVTLSAWSTLLCCVMLCLLKCRLPLSLTDTP